MFWCHIYSHHLDPRSFAPFTTTFWPERWLLASGALASARGVDRAALVHDDAGFLPFSAGPMNCVGKTLAMQEIRMVACALLQRFRLERAPGWDERRVEGEYKDYFTAPRPRFAVRLLARGQ